MDTQTRSEIRALIEGNCRAALATLDQGAPAISLVLYAIERRSNAAPALLIHVSRLAAHTGQLRADPRAALLIMAADAGDDPQAAARISLTITASPLERDNPDYPAARAAYLAALPQQAYLFDFPDFTLFRLELQSARYVGGFARAFSLDAVRVAEILKELDD